MHYTAKDTELDLWRSGLLASATKARDVTDAAQALAKAANTLQRVREAECNGVPQPGTWDPARREYQMGLTTADIAKLETQCTKAQTKVRDTLFSVLARGFVVKYYPDPRGTLLRVTNRDNTRDFLL